MSMFPLALLFGGFDGLLLYAWLLGLLSFWPWLGLHLACVIAFALIIHRISEPPVRVGWATSIIVLGGLLPASGLIGLWLCMAAAVRRGVGLGLTDAYQQMTSARSLDQRRFKEMNDPHDHLRRELSTQPILERLLGEDTSDVQAAIGTLTKVSGPFAVSLLTKGLHDENHEVRLYSSLGLLKIEEQFVAAIEEARQALDEQPNAQHQLALGNCFKAYCDSGLPEGPTLRHFLEVAREAYEAALLLDPSLEEATTGLGWILLKLHRFEEAIAQVDTVLTQGDGTEDLLLIRMQALFNLGKLDALRADARRLLLLGPKRIDVREAIEYWLEIPDDPEDLLAPS